MCSEIVADVVTNAVTNADDELSGEDHMNVRFWVRVV